jgi:hypothetical protein
MDQSILAAHEFHAKLRQNYHPRTRHIYSTGVPTTVGVKIRSGRRGKMPPRTRCPRQLPIYEKIEKPIGDSGVTSEACINYLKGIGQTDIIKVSSITHDALNEMADDVAEHVRGIQVTRGGGLRPWRRGRVRIRQGRQALGKPASLSKELRCQILIIDLIECAGISLLASSHG